VFNINEVITLPSQYILHRWTKYAKIGYSSNNPDNPQETLQTRAARISRKATAVALKCSVSEELLVELEKAIDMLDLEADESLSQRGPAKPESVAMNLNVCSENVTNANISFKVPQAIKGPMVKRAKDAVEKKGPKKPKSGTKKPKSGTKKGSATPTIISLTIRQAVKFASFIWYTNSRCWKQSKGGSSGRRRPSTVYGKTNYCRFFNMFHAIQLCHDFLKYFNTYDDTGNF
jgi:hypothetical protein